MIMIIYMTIIQVSTHTKLNYVVEDFGQKLGPLNTP
jgi:hypothetical protein